MKTHAKIITIIIVATLFITCSTNTPYATSIPKQKFRRSASQQVAFQIDNLLNNAPTQMAWWGVKVQYANTGKVIYERNASKMFLPASNVKMYTTAAALCLLGPEYRYGTDFVTNGTLDNGILKGDLIIRGSGDPTWSERFYDSNYDSVMVCFVDSLKALGISEINGKIIGDDNVFDDLHWGAGWMWDDEYEWHYAELSGLSFNENYIDYTLIPDSSTIGNPVIIEPLLKTSYINLRNDMVTVGSKAEEDWRYGRNHSTNDCWFEGDYSIQSGVDEADLTIHNPTLFTAHVLKEYLLDAGIKVNGNPVDADDLIDSIDYEQTSILFTYISHPMSRVIAEANQPSSNHIAETLQKTLGNELGEGGTSKEGLKIQMAFYDSLGMDVENLYLRDGSGLSRYNLVSPSNSTSLLQVMWDHDYRDDFVKSFPIAGVIGSIDDRMMGSNAVGSVHAKTGNMTNVSSLSGYAWTKSGEPMIFSIMVNNHMTGNSKVKPLQDKIAIILSDME
ncbi:MAG: D-alanyl-D-alanine carboxypeptidase/D-alanyl-D-alanine-endopeptidase [Candidatus Marinimicrobia bacterium]|nr:D-alanyl-D-alanine carboxypeptidase/D-alanyl-D-alanine-endopeptidase [Candidatus Neomarinimicrobiota bacterium]MBT4361499.1 D-alanyl-D-alanine carboxypeptidase/D-alanyl-D-alanine-endopeptidase [Candidatus Neomarinimicrobiota bacterium]MBT4713937.1 D-alanyl-D-alanine carboxypeptidase/D-alanyl-D-alanine-endopeptidase [Candidatus Neomarinimicrobiota bacterium]MBT4946464.1 D-alanyl-D-alanine carboxypeptidase/D-alanyl-D-alanine-endopeptidase [Candidatus Neomarinimicrobiota bacterium]MBT5269544.1 